MTKEERIKFFIFSDESGSWHNTGDVYVRSWIVITESQLEKLRFILLKILKAIGANELSWRSLAGNVKYFDLFKDLDFRIFITVTSPKDIDWETKYSITQNFEISMSNFYFGKLDNNLQNYIKERLYRDIKNALFLNFYEKIHIENAKKGIERVIKPTNYELIYRIDPPQMPQIGWKTILNDISGTPVNIEFPKSTKSAGIQFSDVIAGCCRSIFIKDSNYDVACQYFKIIKDKLISKNKENPNPNLIFYGEINKELIKNCGAIWEI